MAFNGRYEESPQYMARTRYMERALERFATPLDKRFHRKQAIRRRREYCKLFESSSENKYPLPDITKRNLEGPNFFSLPYELRKQIYDEYYASESVESLEIEDITYDGAFMLNSYKPVSKQWPPGRGNTSVRNKLLGLPLTCRIIHAETMMYIYERINLRFMDPRLAIAIPDMIPMKLLNVVRSMHFSFFLHLIADHLYTPERDTPRPELDRLMSPLPKYNQMRAWASLWPALASLRNLQHLSIKIHKRQSGKNWLPHVDYSTPLLELPPWLSQCILNPLLAFEAGKGPNVSIELCWRPQDMLIESLETAGVKVSMMERTAWGF